MEKYWEKENPLEIKEGNLKLQFYDKADALNLKMFYYDSEKNRVSDSIKTSMSFRKKFIKQSPEVLLTLKEIFTEWHEELEKADSDD